MATEEEKNLAYDKEAATGLAELTAQGLLEWKDDGFTLSDKGLHRAFEIWKALPINHRILLDMLIPMIDFCVEQEKEE